MKRRSVFFPDELWNQLGELAKELNPEFDRSMLLRQWCREHVAKHAKAAA